MDERTVVKVEVVEGKELDCMAVIAAAKDGQAQIQLEGTGPNLMNLAMHLTEHILRQASHGEEFMFEVLKAAFLKTAMDFSFTDEEETVPAGDNISINKDMLEMMLKKMAEKQDESEDGAE